MIMADARDTTLLSIEKRFRDVLQYLSDKEVETLLTALDNVDFSRIEKPSSGLIMLQANDAFDLPFYLGEVLVSVAEVECAGIRGQATVIGDAPRKALLAAVVNATVRHSEGAGLLRKFSDALDAYVKRVESVQALEAKMVASTRVHFDSMAPEEN